MASKAGFSLLEILAVLVIMGVLMGIVLSRVTFSPEQEVTLEEIKNHLRYAQLKSLNSDYLCGIRFENKKYFFFCDFNANQKIDPEDQLLLPGENNKEVEVSFLQQNLQIVYDNWGRPFQDLLLSTHLEGNLNLGQGQTLYVTRETGFIP